MLLARL